MRSAWLLVALSVVSTILHSISSDYFRNAFIRRLAGKTADDDERRVFSEELARLKELKGHWFDKTLVRIYLKYLGLQSGRPAPAAPTPPPAVSAVTAALWNLIGPSTHITFIILAALFFSPVVLFAFVIVAANLWMAMLFLVRAVLKPDRTRT